MRDLITWYKECAAENPKLTFVITVWLCIIAPLGFVPDSVTQSETVRAFVTYVSGWAPMIKDFASHSSRPDWHGFALSVIWAWGPIVMLYAAIHSYRTIHPEVDKKGKKRMSSLFAFWATLFFGLFIVAMARSSYNDLYIASYRTQFTTTVMNNFFGNAWSVWTIGWAMVWSGWGATGISLGYYAARKVESI